MSIFRKIFTAVRGGAREVGESIVDANAVRILDQEIKDAEKKIDMAKRDLTNVKAQEMQASRKITALKNDILKNEGYVTQALNKGDESLALEIAQRIASNQSELEIQEKAEKSFSSHEKRLGNMIKKTAKSVADMQRQLVMVKTTESVQKSISAISQNYASSSSELLTAKESLDRIKQKQQDFDDRMAAGEALASEINGDDLDARMREAGIIENDNQANEILQRLKNKGS